MLKIPKLKVKALNEKDLAKLKMGSYWQVCLKADEPPRMIIIEYKGGKKGEKPIALVGKGITLILEESLLNLFSMDEMKWDMCGAELFLVLCVHLQA